MMNPKDPVLRPSQSDNVKSTQSHDSSSNHHGEGAKPVFDSRGNNSANGSSHQEQPTQNVEKGRDAGRNDNCGRQNDVLHNDKQEDIDDDCSSHASLPDSMDRFPFSSATDDHDEGSIVIKESVNRETSTSFQKLSHAPPHPRPPLLENNNKDVVGAMIARIAPLCNGIDIAAEADYFDRCRKLSVSSRLEQKWSSRLVSFTYPWHILVESAGYAEANGIYYNYGRNVTTGEVVFGRVCWNNGKILRFFLSGKPRPINRTRWFILESPLPYLQFEMGREVYSCTVMAGHTWLPPFTDWQTSTGGEDPPPKIRTAPFLQQYDVHLSATCLTAVTRRMICQRQYKRLRLAVVRLQAWGRMVMVIRRFGGCHPKNWRSILKLQAWSRMVLARRAWGSHLQAYQRHVSIWKPLITSLSKLESPHECSAHKTTTPWNSIKAHDSSWESVKTRHFDMTRSSLERYGGGKSTSLTIEDTEVLDSAVQMALGITGCSDNKENDDTVTLDLSGDKDNLDDEGVDKKESSKTEISKQTSIAIVAARPQCDHIQLTKHVIRWLDRQDSKYRGFFVRRIQQLALGERSRILMKHLTGTRRTTIWETYLEQKSGQRILWTEYKYEPRHHLSEKHTERQERGILVWYVAKHDQVSRLINLIDNAESRSWRQLTTGASSLFVDGNIPSPESTSKREDVDDDRDVLKWHDESHRIIADPLGDIPLKVHILHREELSNFTSTPSWKPPLQLTKEERSCVEKEGTVLLLGRSGTG